MKKWLLFATLVSYVFSSAVAQGERKLRKLYHKAKYEKCAATAKKLIHNNSRNGFAHLMYAKSNVRLYQTGASFSIKKRRMGILITSYSRAKKYGSRDSDFYLDTLRPIAESLCGEMLAAGDTVKAKFVAKKLAKHLLDTLDFYKNMTVKKVLNASEPILNHSLNKEDSIREVLLRVAASLQGVPYSYGGESENGFDCSGFTKFVYSKIGVELPHNAHLQSQLGDHKSLDSAKQGDLVFFGYKNGKGYRAVHAAIIYNNEPQDSSVVHCVTGGVAIEGTNSSWDRYWKNKILFVSDVLSQNLGTPGR